MQVKQNEHKGSFNEAMQRIAIALIDFIRYAPELKVLNAFFQVEIYFFFILL